MKLNHFDKEKIRIFTGNINTNSDFGNPLVVDKTERSVKNREGELTTQYLTSLSNIKYNKKFQNEKLKSMLSGSTRNININNDLGIPLVVVKIERSVMKNREGGLTTQCLTSLSIIKDNKKFKNEKLKSMVYAL